MPWSSAGVLGSPSRELTVDLGRCEVRRVGRRGAAIAVVGLATHTCGVRLLPLVGEDVRCQPIGIGELIDRDDGLRFALASRR